MAGAVLIRLRQNLEDGTHIVSADRFDLMIKNKEDTTNFIPAHRDFRVIALGTPVRKSFAAARLRGDRG